jgi:hypothetical protein
MRPCRVQEAAVIDCRKAVLVMVHAHVSIEDALGAIRCDGPGPPGAVKRP